jgi:hypothetical protein
MEEWKDGRVEGWKSGRMEEWKDGRVEGWKSGRMEEWKDGRLEGWKIGRMEDWKDGWSALCAAVRGRNPLFHSSILPIFDRPMFAKLH